MTLCPRCHPDNRPTVAVLDLCARCRFAVEQQRVLTWQRESALPTKGD